MVRHSLNYVFWKQHKGVAKDLKVIYSSPTIDQAEINLVAFEVKWDDKFPTFGKSWRRNWEPLHPLFSYSPEIRKAIYTSNAIESVNMSLRKATKNRGSFHNDDAMLKLLCLALKSISKKWTMLLHNWKSALNQFVIYDRRADADLLTERMLTQSPLLTLL